MIDFLTSVPALLCLIILTIVCVMIGKDNIKFIEITTEKLDTKKRNNAFNFSVLLAFLFRFALAFIAAWVLSFTVRFWDINFYGLRAEISGESLLLIVGGLFLLYKGTTEVHEEVEDKGYDVRKVTSEQSSSFGKSMWQSSIINAVFAFDAILLAVGLSNRLDESITRVLVLMIIALTLSTIILLVFKQKLRDMYSKHPSLHILGLCFLILVGFSMILEGAYLSHSHLLGSDVGFIPKNYIYLAIGTALVFMLLSIKLRKENKKGELTS